MFPSPSELDEVKRQLCVSFPHLHDWEYNLEKSDDFLGFAIWGCFALREDDGSEKNFYVTFDLFEGKWQGTWSMGKHCYYWSNADWGDAYLVDTGRCDSLDSAIRKLKLRIGSLMKVFLATQQEPARIGPAPI